MNLCKDCKHFRTGYNCSGMFSDTPGRERPDIGTCQLSTRVTGNPRDERLCKDERLTTGGCGPDGKHFEPPK